MRPGTVVLAVGISAMLMGFSEGSESGAAEFLLELASECLREEELGICLKWKSLAYLDELDRDRETIPLTDYLYLVRDEAEAASEAESRNLSELELPRAVDEKSRRLDEMLWDKVMSLFRRRKLQLALPEDLFEGRQEKGGKDGKKGVGGAMLAAGMMLGMLLKVAMAKIALIAGKALFTAKIALIVSLIVALKKWTGSGGGGHHSEVVYALDHDGHRKSSQDDLEQELAFTSYTMD